MMSESFILSACRTPIGRFRGALSAADRGGFAVAEAVRRARVDVHSVDEVIPDNVLPAGVGRSPARLAARRAGLAALCPGGGGAVAIIVENLPGSAG